MSTEVGRRFQRLSRVCRLLIFFGLACAASAAPPKPSPSPAAANRGPLTYDSFRLVHTRNVFDPDRRPVHPTSGAAASAPATRSDYVALTGIAVDGEKSLAFFSGSRAEYNAVIPAGSKVAGATGSAPAGVAPSAGSVPAAPASAANLDEVRRRMMERRNQEQK